MGEGSVQKQIKRKHRQETAFDYFSRTVDVFFPVRRISFVAEVSVTTPSTFTNLTPSRTFRWEIMRPVNATVFRDSYRMNSRA